MCAPMRAAKWLQAANTTHNKHQLLKFCFFFFWEEEGLPSKKIIKYLGAANFWSIQIKSPQQQNQYGSHTKLTSRYGYWKAINLQNLLTIN